MKVQELIEIMNRGNTNIEEALQIKKYIPIMDKKMFAMDVIAACTDEIDGFISVDRFKMGIYFDMKILKLYTNLEVASNFDEMVQQYDMLYENNMIAAPISYLGDEYDATWTILEQKLDELLIQNSIEAQVVKIVNKLSQTIDTVGDSLQQFNFGGMLPEGTNLLDVITMLK